MEPIALTASIATEIHPDNELIATSIGARVPIGPMQCLKSLDQNRLRMVTLHGCFAMQQQPTKLQSTPRINIRGCW